MGGKKIDSETRERIRAWVIHLMKDRGFPNAKTFALHLGYKQSSPVTMVISRKRSAGLDFVLRIHRAFHIQTDTLLDHYPPKWSVDEDYKLS